MNRTDADSAVLFWPNGVDLDTGQTSPPLTTRQIVQYAHKTAIEPRAIAHGRIRREDQLGLESAYSSARLVEAGWGVIFASGEDPGIRDALRPLLEHRKQAACSRYREFFGADGYRPGEGKITFMKRHRAPTSGTVDPLRMPYYLLLVGDPEQIPFSFQSQLDLQYAVGRISFDTPEEYTGYARSVVAAERTQRRVGRVVFFGPRHDNDRATELSADVLIPALAATAREESEAVEVLQPAAATKDALVRLLGQEGPALLFTAGHGVMTPRADESQKLRHQGALLCQGWRQSANIGPVESRFIFGADDIGQDADLTGLVAFLFACHSGGTQRIDSYFKGEFAVPRSTSQRSFLAALPMRMLARGALAVVAHIDRVWTTSFYRDTEELATFRSALRSLLRGETIGAAMEVFGNRHGELAAQIAQLTEEEDMGADTTYERALAWIDCNDARNFLVLGDPAVRLSPIEPRRTPLSPSAANARVEP